MVKLKTLEDLEGKVVEENTGILWESYLIDSKDMRQAAREWIEQYKTKDNKMYFDYYWEEFLEEHYDENGLKEMMIAWIKHFFNLEEK